MPQESLALLGFGFLRALYGRGSFLIFVQKYYRKVFTCEQEIGSNFQVKMV